MVREARKGAPCVLTKNVPYPLVPSKKEKESHFVRFLNILKKLEITIPFGEALQHMSMYTKF